MADWKDWSKWIEEGWYVSYRRETVRYFEYVWFRDLAHWEYTWPESIAAGADSGPYIPVGLEITAGYDYNTNMNHLWQLIFGIMGQAYIYVELPPDLHRHGLAKQSKPGTALREVSHFEEWMSPFQEPSFLTEHILIRPENYNIGFTAYNPPTNLVSVTPKLNIFCAKLITERVGTEEYGELSTPQLKDEKKTERLNRKWSNILNVLYTGVKPCKPLTLMPVSLPAAVPSGV